MKSQNYSNHVRYYTPHHFVFYPILLLGFIASIYCIFHYPDRSGEWFAISALILMLGWCSYIMRQHYALGNQNRIVRLEMRLRYYMLTQQSLDPIERKLSFGQLAALRFASDKELPALIQRAVNENLSAANIKKAIKNWQADDMRV